MVSQFEGARYKAPDGSGWDNHRWIRSRALLSCLPEWLAAYADGRALLDLDPDRLRATSSAPAAAGASSPPTCLWLSMKRLASPARLTSEP